MGSSIGVKQIAEPLFWSLGVGPLPRIPRQIRLRSPSDEAPVVRTDVAPLGDRKDSFHGAPQPTSEVLGTEDRSSQRGEFVDASFEVGGVPVVVEADDVRVLELHAADRAAASGIFPVPVPDAAGQ